MKYKIIRYIIGAFILVLCSSSCVNKSPFSEFVKTINFSNLDSFKVENILLTGLNFRKSDQVILERLSEEIITYKLSSLGFVPASSTIDADFSVIITWKKALSYYSNPTDHIDPYAQVLARKNDRIGHLIPRLNLLIEIYSNSRNEIFWRKELPNIFDAPELTEDRVRNSLNRAIKGFPARVIKDPNLPTIQ